MKETTNSVYIKYNVNCIHLLSVCRLMMAEDVIVCLLLLLLQWRQQGDPPRSSTAAG